MNSLKEFSKYYIQAQENLNEDQKEELIVYIESASDVEVKALLLSGSKQQVTKEETIAVDKMFELSMDHISESKYLINEVDAGAILNKISSAYSKFKVPKIDVKMELPPWFPKIGGTKIGIGGSADKFQATYDKAKLALGSGTVIGAAVIAALVALVAKKAYMSYLSKAAKACKGASDKNNCLKKYYIDSLKAEIEALQAGKSSCTGTNDPEKCKFLLDVKIKKKNNKIVKLIKKL